MKNSQKNTFIVLIILLFSSMFQNCSNNNGLDTTKTENVLEKMLRTKQLVVGYAGYPPFLIRDPNSEKISGYSVDILQAIVEPLKVSVQWKETTWDNMKQDIMSNKFDLMVEPVFMTIPRSAQVGFTNPYAYFGYAVVLVSINESRFNSIEDLNNPDITIAITQGVTDQEYADNNLIKANRKYFPVNDISITLTEVLVGKADAALADVPSIIEFLKAHPKKVKALFLENPPASTPAAFMTRKEEVEFINFLNSSILYLDANGLFDKLDKKYSLPSYRVKKEFIKGSALK